MNASFQEAFAPFAELAKSVRMLTPDQIKTLSQAAYGLYEKGNYPKAIDFFTHLILHQPMEAKFWKGLAASRQMNKNYTEAMQAWAMVCLLSPQDPMAHFHAAECLLSLGEKAEALKALECAEKLKGAPLEKIQGLKHGTT